MHKFITGLVLGAGGVIAGVCLYAVGYTDGRVKAIGECKEALEIFGAVFKKAAEQNEEEEEA